MMWELPLKEGVYLELLTIACLRDASVTDHLQFSNASPQWNVNLVRAVND
jgi:hypothetical protein